MAYEGFAAWYDALNEAADYDRLCVAILDTLRAEGITSGIVADLGCGTGEVSLRLAKAGYDMIAVDASADMLSVLNEKLQGQGIERGRVLLLCQDLAQLDLYGTARAMVSTFDTLNHLPGDALGAAFGRATLFLEPGGLFIIDLNTAYKHKTVLGNHRFTLQAPDGLCCEWQNRCEPGTLHITLQVAGKLDGAVLFSEQFNEYYHPPELIERLAADYGLTLLAVADGERFCPPDSQTQRLLYTLKKTKLGKT